MSQGDLFAPAPAATTCGNCVHRNALTGEAGFCSPRPGSQHGIDDAGCRQFFETKELWASLYGRKAA